MTNHANSFNMSLQMLLNVNALDYTTDYGLTLRIASYP